jgi:hypothetical protein
MSLPRTVAEILREHVTLEVESIDRMYLNVYVPGLQSEGSVAWFFRTHRGHLFASSALMAPMSKAFVAAIEAFVAEHALPLITFEKGQRKDEVMAQHLARFTGDEGILFVGKAQEKTAVFRTERRRNPQTGQPYPWLVRSTAMVNHYYFYGVDRDFGPFFLKFCAYFPYTAKLCLNGHEYVKRQLTQRGIAYEALDNGIVSCAEPRLLQALCDGLSAARIEALGRKWLARLPHPFTVRDRRAGYRYQFSILQAEFSLTQVLDRPVTGRIFFDEVIRENLDLGRPDHVQLIFDRRVGKQTPGRFRPGDHRGRHAFALRRVQAHADQAVSQGGARAPDRDDDQRRARLRPRQTAVSPLRPAEGRLSGQPTSSRRPTDQPRLRDRRSRLHTHLSAADGRGTTGRCPALRRPRVSRRSSVCWWSSACCRTAGATAISPPPWPRCSDCLRPRSPPGA